MMMPTAAVTFSQSTYRPGKSTPAYGEHTLEVLAALGYSEADIRASAQQLV